MSPRGRLPDLARLLDASPDPIYVVDGERRITYVSRACADWLGCTPQDLIGRECRYRSGEAADRFSAIADALCPPPAALAGRRTSLEIVPPAGGGEKAPEKTDAQAGDSADGAAAQAGRRADFIPLGEVGDGVTAVLVRLPSPEVAARDEAELRRLEGEAERLHALVARRRREQALRFGVDRIVGESPAVRRIRAQLGVAAVTHGTLSIVGPPGSGRGDLARAVHYQRSGGGEPAGPLVPLDGSVLGAEMLQAAIRGMTRTARETGRRSGTLLINDVDRLPAEAQAELAGFIRLVELPLRVITTSSRPLVPLSDEGPFRPDLAAWLTTLTIEIPRLAARPEDIPPLAQRLLEEVNGRQSKQLGGFTPEALDQLAGYGWPGEAVELAAAVAEAHERAEGPLAGVRDLPKRLFLAADAARYAPPAEPPIALDAYLADVEREVLRRALERARGNKTRAAGQLGLTRPRLHRRLVQLGLEEGPVVFEEAGDEGNGAAEK